MKVKALGLLIRGDDILVEAYHGPHSKGMGDYYRPLGGTIEVGERSHETVVREFKEELGLDITIDTYITCIENIFTIDHELGHEIIQLYAVSFTDSSLYNNEEYYFIEGIDGVAKWLPIKDVLSGVSTVYPDGIESVLKTFLEK
ncbi:NUDIX hydrolase [Pseudalkalibacillus hwajinpoensis]|uniref:NUDIX hydrolase n=1 Tax=Guptibacillus hwajinpoensis TaxID=208199 RepID=UPI001F0D223C|nr:NUDIX domain-containing protein [Pseudalkalibacillus hwajinpoensis]